MDLVFHFLVSKENVLFQLHELFRYFLNTHSQMMQQKKFSFLKLLQILLLRHFLGLVLSMQFIQIYFDGFVGVASMLGSAKGADKGVLMAFCVEADEVNFFSLMSFLGALNILDDVGGDFLFH